MVSELRIIWKRTRTGLGSEWCAAKAGGGSGGDCDTCNPDTCNPAETCDADSPTDTTAMPVLQPQSEAERFRLLW